PEHNERGNDDDGEQREANVTGRLEIPIDRQRRPEADDRRGQREADAFDGDVGANATPHFAQQSRQTDIRGVFVRQTHRPFRLSFRFRPAAPNGESATPNKANHTKYRASIHYPTMRPAWLIAGLRGSCLPDGL